MSFLRAIPVTGWLFCEWTRGFQPNYRTCAAQNSLPIAYCLLPIAYCLLPIAYCLLPIAYCLLTIAY
jgi:hypothetical protein